MTVPHDTWAQVYDMAYEEEFGSLYAGLTALTLEVINSLLPASGGRVVDFGAGTGRLATPLAAAGHQVTAVEPSDAMLSQLRDPPEGQRIERHCLTMQDFRSTPRFDLALCVFTVVIYLTEEDALRSALRSAASCLVPGGRMFIDVPSGAIFADRRRRTPRLLREVCISTEGDSPVRTYRERIDVLHGPLQGQYTDEFRIRHWQSAEVLKVAVEEGFVVERNLSDTFAVTGAEYWVLSRL